MTSEINSIPHLTERAQHILRVLVEHYLHDGQPVGSRTLSRDAGLGVSPATVRNVMSDLEELGFIHSPHTSAGRVPTVQGYRFFVDTLLSIKPLQELDLDGIEPTSHASRIENVFREDQVCPSLDREDVLKNAPAEIKHQFRVPKIVE